MALDNYRKWGNPDFFFFDSDPDPDPVDIGDIPINPISTLYHMYRILLIFFMVMFNFPYMKHSNSTE